MKEDYIAHLESDGSFSVSYTPPGIKIKVVGSEEIPLVQEEAEQLIKELRLHKDKKILDKHKNLKYREEKSDNNDKINPKEGK